MPYDNSSLKCLKSKRVLINSWYRFQDTRNYSKYTLKKLKAWMFNQNCVI